MRHREHSSPLPTAGLADRLSKFMLVSAAALTFVLAIVILADIASRVAFNRPLGGAADIVGNATVMIVFLQAGYAVRSRSMMRAEFLVGLMPWALRRVVFAAGYALGALVFGVLFLANWEPMLNAIVTNNPGFPDWPARTIVVIGAMLTSANYVLLALADLKGPEPTLDSEIAELKDLEP